MFSVKRVSYRRSDRNFRSLSITGRTCIERLSRWIVILAFPATIVGQAQEVPPLAPLRGDAASLPDTMKFIQDKLPGKLNFIHYKHDNVSGVDAPATKISYELTNASADANRCRIGWHIRITPGRSGAEERDNEIFLKQVKEITVQQYDQAAQRQAARQGHPELSIKTDPPVFVVDVKADKEVWFYFYEDTLADRVSKAMNHAVDLCGGGNPEPF